MKIYNSIPVKLGNHVIKQALPLRGVEQISPFILLHHFDFEVEPGDYTFDVPPHPHRGFCPVTFLFEGSVEHKDSLGNQAVISENEVQWINAGRGIIHSERASKDFVARGGRYQGVQLWINLPKADKMNTPSYQPIKKDEIVLWKDNGIEFRLISGTYKGVKGPVNHNSLTATLHMSKGSSFELNFHKDENSAIYILEGRLTINGEIAPAYSLIYFNETERNVELKCLEDAKILVLSGKAIHEPMMSYGPYVMNTQTEILEAMRDFQDGKMGFLP